MSYFAVTRNAGPAWTDGKSAFEQPGAGDHVRSLSVRGRAFGRCPRKNARPAVRRTAA